MSRIIRVAAAQSGPIQRAESRQAVVKHLGVLEDATLVKGVRDGRRVVYELTPGKFVDAARWMHDVGVAWDRRLAKLRDRVTKRP